MIKTKGFALVFTMSMILLVMLVVLSFASITTSDLTTANRACNTMRAYYIAEAGLARKFMDLRSGNTSTLSGTFTIASGYSGTFSVNVTLVSGGAFSTYRLDSTGTYKDVSRTVSLTLRQVSWARYSYLTNDEDQLFWIGRRWVIEVPIWFVTGDLLSGPLHSNDQLNIAGDPIFDGPVTSVASSINYYNGGPPNDNPDFRESLSLGVSGVQIPTSATLLTPIKNAAQSEGGLYLIGNTIITLLPDGTMDVTNNAKSWTTPTNVPLPANSALYVENGYVDISGILNGQLTIGTNNNIYVVNNILYNSDPRTDPSSNDMLALVSQNNVYVDAAAPDNLEIDAYIVALNTSFKVENYNTILKDILTIYGGLTQERRGPIGTFNGTTGEKVSGYSKNYNYDTRFQNMAPAYFPPARDNDNRIVYVKVRWSEG